MAAEKFQIPENRLPEAILNRDINTYIVLNLLYLRFIYLKVREETERNSTHLLVHFTVTPTTTPGTGSYHRANPASGGPGAQGLPPQGKQKEFLSPTSPGPHLTVAVS